MSQQALPAAQRAAGFCQTLSPSVHKNQHLTPSMGDGSAFKHLWEDLNGVFQNL